MIRWPIMDSSRAFTLVSLTFTALALGALAAACGQIKDSDQAAAESQLADLVVTATSDDCSPTLFTGVVQGTTLALDDGGANVPLYDLPPTSSGSARQDVHYDETVRTEDVAPPNGCAASVRRLEIGPVTHTTSTIVFPVTDTFHDLGTCDGGALFGDLTVTPRNDCVSKRVYTFTYPAR